MGVRPAWDHASTRVTGFEIVPLPLLDRPRIDVAVRVSGAFRDTFPDQLGLLDHLLPGVEYVCHTEVAADALAQLSIHVARRYDLHIRQSRPPLQLGTRFLRSPS